MLALIPFVSLDYPAEVTAGDEVSFTFDLENVMGFTFKNIPTSWEKIFAEPDDHLEREQKDSSLKNGGWIWIDPKSITTSLTYRIPADAEPGTYEFPIDAETLLEEDQEEVQEITANYTVTIEVKKN